jgi:DNA-binding transcriptional ArsR family regulator
MDADADLAAVAGLIGEPARAGILLSLLEGRPLRAGELATRSRLSPSLASMHLRKLLDGGLVDVAREGRERRYRIASPSVARAVESLLRIAPGRPARSLRESQRGEALRAGRTCYDHLAGRLGVALTEAMGERHLLHPLDGSYQLTGAGRSCLENLGVDVAGAEAGRRAFARQCLDWTERRPHLAGALGAAITGRLFDLRWLERRPGTRAVRLTPAGDRGLREEFGLDLGVDPTQLVDKGRALQRGSG